MRILTALAATLLFASSAQGAPTFTEVKKIVADDAAENAFFGESVRLVGDELITGAFRDQGMGAVYVHRADEGGAWNCRRRRRLERGLGVCLRGQVRLGGRLHRGRGM